MNFSESNNIQGTLPQFSEITLRTNPIFNEFNQNNINSSTIELPMAQQGSVYTVATGLNQNKQQFIVNSPNKYPGSLLTLSDSSAIMQLYEKQCAINIPNYNQNNASLISVQSNPIPMRVIPNVYLPSTSQIDTSKEENKTDNEIITSEDIQQVFQLQGSNMTEYIQKIQATTMPLINLQIMKLQNEQYKDDKLDHIQNNILNIPSVPGFRNAQLQNGNHFINSEQIDASLNHNDLSVHLASNQQVCESNMQVMKVEQQVQTDPPKSRKVMKFKAKIKEFKVLVGLDGSKVYSCPDCNEICREVSQIKQHRQIHIQERKYQCELCSAMLKRKEHLDQHMRGHSDVRPYQCSLCEKAFKRNEHLRRHNVIHSGNKNFICPTCQKAFARKDHLHKHAQTHSARKKSKSKKDVFCTESKEIFEKTVEVLAMPKQQEINFLVKDGSIKCDANLLQHIQHLQKDQLIFHGSSLSITEEVLRDMMQQQFANISENISYIMPS
ncbi:PREDICTED: zinc finger protein 880-like [Polistes canadensis]|uniref:zinc finger protein 880-like n=1 Tax=Polistes canadensis TaxID=91411 RepID=UPI000718AD76|nr:PREDICTED: zinc finger protein 880-like [Polistes canadensis]XP_014616638.1 PREDICTED: zinc finger protein 880-like [Polistes canadensis]